MKALAAAGLLALALAPGAGGIDAARPVTHEYPKELVVALSLPAPGFQAGAVRGRDVVAARGLEVDLARMLAARLGVRRVKLVHVPDRSRLVAPGEKTWHLALAQLPPGAPGVDFSRPYLADRQAVLFRRGLPRVRSLDELAGLGLCAVRGSGGAYAIARLVRPGPPPTLVADRDRLLRLVRVGRCDAGLLDAHVAGRALAGVRDLYGDVAAIETGSGFAVALERGSPLARKVDAAVARLRTDGTVHRLARAWLGVDPNRLRVIH